MGKQSRRGLSSQNLPNVFLYHPLCISKHPLRKQLLLRNLCVSLSYIWVAR